MEEFFENGFRVNFDNQRFFISYLINSKKFNQKGYFVAQIIFSKFSIHDKIVNLISINYCSEQ